MAGRTVHRKTCESVFKEFVFKEVFKGFVSRFGAVESDEDFGYIGIGEFGAG